MSFTCDEYRQKQGLEHGVGWPFMGVSYGRCEDCGKSRACEDLKPPLKADDILRNSFGLTPQEIDSANGIGSESAAERAKIAAWTREWFETHAPAHRDDFDLITMLKDYRDHLLTPQRGNPVDLNDGTWGKILASVIENSCARCGAPLDASGNCARRQRRLSGR